MQASRPVEILPSLPAGLNKPSANHNTKYLLGDLKMADVPEQEITKLSTLADDSHRDAFLAELNTIHPTSVEDMNRTLQAISQKRGELIDNGTLPKGEGLGVVNRTNTAGGDFRLVGQHTHIIIPPAMFSK